MKKVYKIIGLDCPNCAKIVENHLNSNPLIKDATIDLIGEKLFIEYQGNEELSIKVLNDEIRKIENDVKVYDFKRKSDDDNNKKTIEITILRIVFSSIILAIAHFCSWAIDKNTSIFLYVIAYLLSSYDVLIKMFKRIFKKQIFTEYSLMGIATIGAIILGEYIEAIIIMSLYQIGELLQDYAVDKSRKLIKDTMELRANSATLVLEDGNLKIVTPEILKVDDIIDIKVGEMIPVDSIIINGEGTLDMSSLTGESLPVKVKENDELLSGTILTSGHIIARVNRRYEDSAAAKILDIIENNRDKKSKVEKFITKFSNIYTPIVFLLAFIVGVIIPLINKNWEEYTYKALVLLVASCPCSLIISIPLTYFVGIGELARKGIIIKGANHIDSLKNTKTVVVDKTGTLTKGKFSVVEIKCFGIDESEFIEAVVYAESISNHPLALSILEYFNIVVDNDLITKKEEIVGKGIKITYKNKQVLVGNNLLVKSAEIQDKIGSIIYVEVDGKYVGYIVLKDEIRETTEEFISKIHSKYIKTVMLTGDKKEYALLVGEKLKINEVYYELLPNQKSEHLEEILKDFNNKSVVYIGDGINDAPCLALADVGIAMGAVGSDSAIENADIVVMNDNLNSVISAIEISKKIHKTSIFNVVFSLSFKLIVYILALLNYSSMWIALIADVGVTLLLVLNSLMLKRRIK